MNMLKSHDSCWRLQLQSKMHAGPIHPYMLALNDTIRWHALLAIQQLAVILYLNHICHCTTRFLWTHWRFTSLRSSISIRKASANGACDVSVHVDCMRRPTCCTDLASRDLLMSPIIPVPAPVSSDMLSAISLHQAVHQHQHQHPHPGVIGHPHWLVRQDYKATRQKASPLVN